MDFEEIELPLLLKTALHTSSRPDDLYTSIENHYRNWQSQSHIQEYKFESEFDLWLASIFLENSAYLLPSNIIRALGSTIINSMNEAASKKYSLESLFIVPPKAGRKKEDHSATIHTLMRGIIVNKRDRDEVYAEAAKERNKSIDTIRRIYERFVQEKVKKSSKPREYYYGKIKK